MWFVSNLCMLNITHCELKIIIKYNSYLLSFAFLLTHTVRQTIFLYLNRKTQCVEEKKNQKNDCKSHKNMKTSQKLFAFIACACLYATVVPANKERSTLHTTLNREPVKLLWNIRKKKRSSLNEEAHAECRLRISCTKWLQG